MATLSVIGNTLVDTEELQAKRITGELNMPGGQVLRINNETISQNDLTAIQLERNFTPIGIGKPMSIEIATVYIGEYKKFLGGRKDVILVSGVKSSQTFKATSRAINMKADKVEENAYLEFNALEEGTNIVYYTPGMDADNLTASFELMFDNFDTQIFETLSGLFTSAAGIPVFLPAAPYLLGGSQLVNIGSKLGDALFSGRPNLSSSMEVKFDSPIIRPTEPREFIICNNNDLDEFKNLKVALSGTPGNKKLRLVDKQSGAVYKGKAPYLIILLDGRKRQDLEGFAPTLATASLLKKFYGPEDKTGEVTGALQDAMKLYNDSVYNRKGKRLKEQLEQYDRDSEEYKKLKSLYEAYSANIQTDTFKLPVIAE